MKELSLELYADGLWYKMPDSERRKTRPLIVNNNWVIGWLSTSVMYVEENESCRLLLNFAFTYKLGKAFPY